LLLTSLHFLELILEISLEVRPKTVWRHHATSSTSSFSSIDVCSAFEFLIHLAQGRNQLGHLFLIPIHLRKGELFLLFKQVLDTF
jgi:hypothetical protein